jgi:hypothetical protein
MGDRANIHTFSTQGGLYLYTHWGGEDLPLVLQAALRRGQSRWGDESYLNRIIFCEMIAHDVMGLTGYGVSTFIPDNEHPIIEVDNDAGTVTIGTQRWTFAEYIAASEADIESAYRG